MIIPCSEKCVYEKEGLCTLKSVTTPSNTPTKNCPYFKERGKAKDTQSENQIRGIE
ncbi:MAG: hypothetical protein WC983_11025 [Tissierellaceae bacterium]